LSTRTSIDSEIGLSDACLCKKLYCMMLGLSYSGRLATLYV